MASPICAYIKQYQRIPHPPEKYEQHQGSKPKFGSTFASAQISHGNIYLDYPVMARCPLISKDDIIIIVYPACLISCFILFLIFSFAVYWNLFYVCKIFLVSMIFSVVHDIDFYVSAKEYLVFGGEGLYLAEIRLPGSDLPWSAS